MIKCPLCKALAKYRFGLGHTSVWECAAAGCRLVFADPQLDDKNLVLAYASHYYPPNGNGFTKGYENTPEQVLRQVFEEVELELGPLSGKKLLDFGCGVGTLCRIAGTYGMSATGIESNEIAREKASRTTGVRTFENLSELVAAQPGVKFEVVTMWDVIEHLREPWNELAELSAILQPGGWLLVSTPNVASLRAVLEGKRWENMVNPTHFYYFSRVSLKSTLTRGGFASISELRQLIRYPAHGMVRRIAHQALVFCRLQGQLVFVARPQPLTTTRCLERNPGIEMHAAG